MLIPPPRRQNTGSHLLLLEFSVRALPHGWDLEFPLHDWPTLQQELIVAATDLLYNK